MKTNDKKNDSTEKKGAGSAESVLGAWHYRLPVRFLEARRALIDIRRFSALYKYYNSYTVDMFDPSLPKIEDLIKNLDKKWQHEQLINEMNKMIPSILYRFRRVEGPTGYIITYRGQKKHIDIFNEPSYAHQLRYSITKENLQRVEGRYERFVESFWHQVYSPMYWLSRILSLPITILARTGVNVESQSTMVFFYWLMQAMMAIILGWIIFKLKIPNDIINFVTK